METESLDLDSVVGSGEVKARATLLPAARTGGHRISGRKRLVPGETKPAVEGKAGGSGTWVPVLPGGE